MKIKRTNQIFSNVIFRYTMTSNEPQKEKRRRWSKMEEQLLLNIISNYDEGRLKKVIIDYKTNVKMSRHDAWESVT